jgi:hypothetical protein
LREDTDQTDVVAKTDQERAVFRSQNILQKNFQVMLVLLGKPILASAEVHNQSERQGHIHATGKEGDFLRDGVLENLDIILGEIVDQCSSGIPRSKSNVHEPDVNSDRLLGPADADGEKRNKEGQSAHESSS